MLHAIIYVYWKIVGAREMKPGDLVIHQKTPTSQKRIGVLLRMSVESGFDSSEYLCRVLFAGDLRRETVLMSSLKRASG